MLVGTYYHTLEAKGRFSLPKVFRQDTTAWVLTSGLDGCLYVFRQSDFDAQVEKLAQLSYFQAKNRALVRHLAGNASPQITDQLGRLTVPTQLIAYAALKKQIVVVGQLNHLEVWDAERYREMMDRLEQTVEDAAEQVTLEE